MRKDNGKQKGLKNAKDGDKPRSKDEKNVKNPALERLITVYKK